MHHERNEILSQAKCPYGWDPVYLTCAGYKNLAYHTWYNNDVKLCWLCHKAEEDAILARKLDKDTERAELKTLRKWSGNEGDDEGSERVVSPGGTVY